MRFTPEKLVLGERFHSMKQQRNAVVFWAAATEALRPPGSLPPPVFSGAGEKRKVSFQRWFLVKRFGAGEPVPAARPYFTSVNNSGFWTADNEALAHLNGESRLRGKANGPRNEALPLNLFSPAQPAKTEALPSLQFQE